MLAAGSAGRLPDYIAGRLSCPAPIFTNLSKQDIWYGPMSHFMRHFMMLSNVVFCICVLEPVLGPVGNATATTLPNLIPET